MEITKTIVAARIRTNWDMLGLHLQDILLVIYTLKFVCNSSFVPTH